jgi:AP-2 complex subunit beta-1
MPSAMFLPHYLPPPGYSSAYSPYFRTAQGKVAELRLELNSGGKKDKNHAAKKIALKKIVANMTMSNNDMVALFPDIVGCLFLVNYARMKPDVALKALPILQGVL